MKNYIDSPQHWEDSVNADYDYREDMAKYQIDDREQPCKPKPCLTCDFMDGCVDEKRCQEQRPRPNKTLLIPYPE